MKSYKIKIIKQLKVGIVAQAVDNLPSKCEGLSSNPSTIQKKKNPKQNKNKFKFKEINGM
jgi:hypothetical protein